MTHDQKNLTLQQTDNAGRPRLLIEDWLPAAAIGVECMRERNVANAPLPHTRLHVWWARRPLAISRAAILGSLLPSDFNRPLFERLMGFEKGATHIVEVGRLFDQGIKTKDGFGTQRSFKANVPYEDFQELKETLSKMWGSEVNTLDLFSGGGSIPFESARLGLKSIANEYNPVACAVLEAGTVYPFTFGEKLANSTRKWTELWIKRVNNELERFYPKPISGSVQAYLYARTVPCPDTGFSTPLVPDWTLLKKGRNTIHAQVNPNKQTGEWNLEIVENGKIPRGSVVDGDGISIFTGTLISSDYIKAKAQNGEMGSVLYAIAIKRPRSGISFIAPSQLDLDAIENAKIALHNVQESWEQDYIVPTEKYPDNVSDERPIIYGMPKWKDMFTSRQLLAFGTMVKTLKEMRQEIITQEGENTAEAIEHLLAFSIDKLLNYNSVLCSWHAPRSVMRSVFDRHDFSFKWTFAEMAPVSSSSGLAWAADNVITAYEEMATLSRDKDSQPVEIIQGSSTNLVSISDKSVSAVITDPPYDDNVQYSELSDFFYVWLKRTQGHRRPEWFIENLTNNKEEAVVNKNRFLNNNIKPKEAERLSRDFYREMMYNSFKEAHRVLRDDGALTVMFTHKKQEAWAALFEGLVKAGFTITATWPIKTESEHSLHQAKKNAAQSTVLLVARKRPEGAGIGFFTKEMRQEIEDAARKSAERLQNDGLNGVDQLVGSFGPAMEVYSRYDVVKTDTGEEISVAHAIDLAASAVSQWRVDKLAGRTLDGIEAEGKFVLLCWDVLGAAEFRFNEAKLLGNAVGMDVSQLEMAGLVSKSGENIKMLSAQDRRRDKALEPDEVNTMFGPMPTGKRRTKKDALKVHPNDPSFRTALDAVHALALRFLEVGGGDAGIGNAKQLARQQGFTPESTVAQLMHTLLKVAPEAVRSGSTEIGKRYPEFRAWKAMIEPLFDIPAPEWTLKQAPQGAMQGLFEPAAEEEGDDLLDDAED